MNDADKTIGQFALVSDFGSVGPYLGQVRAVLAEHAPHVPVVDLLSNAPVFNPKATAYLLRAISSHMPRHTLFLCVVDPGVGSDRMGLIVETEKHLFIGPDNGLLSQIARDSDKCRVWSIGSDLQQVSPTFHGRDVFAPTAASLANDGPVVRKLIPTESLVGWAWPADLYETIYIDHYGNIFTGISGKKIAQNMTVTVKSEKIRYARTFSEVPSGELFWYVNSCGLVEIAANMVRASDLLAVSIGEAVAIG